MSNDNSNNNSRPGTPEQTQQSTTTPQATAPNLMPNMDWSNFAAMSQIFQMNALSPFMKDQNSQDQDLFSMDKESIKAYYNNLKNQMQQFGLIGVQAALFFSYKVLPSHRDQAKMVQTAFTRNKDAWKKYDLFTDSVVATSKSKKKLFLEDLDSAFHNQPNNDAVNFFKMWAQELNEILSDFPEKQFLKDIIKTFTDNYNIYGFMIREFPIIYDLFKDTDKTMSKEEIIDFKIKFCDFIQREARYISIRNSATKKSKPSSSTTTGAEKSTSNFKKSGFNKSKNVHENKKTETPTQTSSKVDQQDNKSTSDDNSVDALTEEFEKLKIYKNKIPYSKDHCLFCGAEDHSRIECELLNLYIDQGLFTIINNRICDQHGKLLRFNAVPFIKTKVAKDIITSKASVNHLSLNAVKHQRDISTSSTTEDSPFKKMKLDDILNPMKDSTKSKKGVSKTSNEKSKMTDSETPYFEALDDSSQNIDESQTVTDEITNTLAKKLTPMLGNTSYTNQQLLKKILKTTIDVSIQDLLLTNKDLNNSLRKRMMSKRLNQFGPSPPIDNAEESQKEDTEAKVNHIELNITPLLEVGPTVNLPIKYNGAIINGLIDSGSNISIITEDLVKKYDLPKEQIRENLTVGQFNSSHITICAKTSFNFKINDIEYSNVFFISNEVKSKLLFGQNFLIPNNANWQYLLDNTRAIGAEISLDKPYSSEKNKFRVTLLNEIQLSTNQITGDDIDLKNLNDTEKQFFIYNFNKKLQHLIHKDIPDFDLDDLVPTKTSWLQPTYNIPITLKNKVIKELTKMLEEKQLEQSHTININNPIFVKVKSDKNSIRILGDFKTLNENSPLINTPSSNAMKEILNLPPNSIISIADLSAAYHHIRLPNNLRKFTTFNSPIGVLQYKVLPQGYVNSPAIFIHTINFVLQKYRQNILIYMDDLIIHSTLTIKEHLLLVIDIFHQLISYGFSINMTKSHINVKDFKFVGFSFNENMRHPLKEKIDQIKSTNLPTTATELRAFLGLVNFYNQFIPHHQEVASPLYQDINTNPFRLTSDAVKAFYDLKSKFNEIHGLFQPNFQLPFAIATDASNSGYGGLLFNYKPTTTIQDIKKVDLKTIKKSEIYPILHFSRTWKAGDKNKIIFHKELLALNKFAKYIFKLLGPLQMTAIVDNSIIVAHLRKRDDQSLTYNQIYNNLLVDTLLLGLHIISISSNQNPADVLSREVAVVFENDSFEDFAKVNAITTPSMNLNEITFPTAKDLLLINPEELLNIKSTLPDTRHIFNLWYPYDTGIDELIATHSNFITLMAADLETYRFKGLTLKQIYNKQHLEFEELQVEYAKNKGFTHFMLSQGCLFKNSRYPKLVIANPYLIFYIIHQLHQFTHKGINSVVAVIQEYLFVPKLNYFAQLIINACGLCQFHSLQNPIPPPLLLTPARDIFHTIVIDCVHMHQYESYRFLIIARDMTTLWPEAIALKKLDGAAVAKFLFENIISRFGPFSRLISDGGSEFNNAILSSLLNQYSIHHTITVAYHPSSNGISEASHKALTNYLSKLVKWPTMLAQALYVDRIMVKSNGYSPFELVLGYNPFASADSFQIFNNVIHQDKQLSTDDLFKLRIQQLENKELLVDRQGAIKLQQRLAKLYLLSKNQRKNPTFKKGQIVLSQDPIYSQRLNKKAYPRYCGPFKIHEVLKDNVYILKELNGQILSRHFSGDKLIPFDYITNEEPKETYFAGGKNKNYYDPKNIELLMPPLKISSISSYLNQPQ